MNEIGFRNYDPGFRFNFHQFRRILTQALELDLGIQNWRLAFSFLPSRRMALLNEKYLSHQGPTDVITFDYAESAGKSRSKSVASIHGEVFVCPAVAKKQAHEFAATLSLEVLRYAVHGILHLAGYDDSRVRLRRKMKKKEDQVIRALNKRFSLRGLVARRQ